MALPRRLLSADCTGGGSDDYCFTNSPPPIRSVAINPGSHVEYVPLSGNKPNRTKLIPICASLLAFVVILFTYYVACRWYPPLRRRRRSPRDAPPDFPPPPDLPATVEDLRHDFLEGEPYHVWFIRTKGLDEQTIGSISVFSYSKSEGLVDGTDCSICLGEFAEGETLRLLPKCSHAFHLPCIDTWLRSHVNCPLCRAPIIPGASKALLPSNPGYTDAEQGAEPGASSAVEDPAISLAESASRRSESDGRVTIEVVEQEDNRIQGVKVEPLRRSVSVDSGIWFMSRISRRAC